MSSIIRLGRIIPVTQSFFQATGRLVFRQSLRYHGGGRTGSPFGRFQDFAVIQATACRRFSASPQPSIAAGSGSTKSGASSCRPPEVGDDDGVGEAGEGGDAARGAPAAARSRV